MTTGYTLADGINAVVNHASGGGVKVNIPAPTFPWRDLLGNIDVRGGVADPTLAVYQGNIRQRQWSVNDEIMINFHTPHDWAPGTDWFIHLHTSHIATTITGGTFDFLWEFSFAKAFNQAAFVTPVTSVVIACPASTTQYQHMLTEIQITAASPSANQLATSLIEVDGIMMGRLLFSANNSTVSGGPAIKPFVHAVDIHYQSSSIGTVSKAPNFYTP